MEGRFEKLAKYLNLINLERLGGWRGQIVDNTVASGQVWCQSTSRSSIPAGCQRDIVS